jgi:hypothetical protein
MKSSVTRQNVHLAATLASLNIHHNYDLHACCVGVRSSSRPNLVPTRPLHPRNAIWRSSFVANLSSITPGCVLAIEVEACEVTGRCCMASTTLTCNLIWPCNNFVLSRCTSSFLVSPSLASKLVRRRLSLRSSYLGGLAKVSTTQLTTWRTFLATTVVHLGSYADVALVVVVAVASRFISLLTARLLAAMKDAMFSMAASILDSCV